MAVGELVTLADRQFGILRDPTVVGRVGYVWLRGCRPFGIRVNSLQKNAKTIGIIKWSLIWFKLAGRRSIFELRCLKVSENQLEDALNFFKKSVTLNPRTQVESPVKIVRGELSIVRLQRSKHLKSG